MQHRFKCFANIGKIRQQTIPEFGLDKQKETILIEMRPGAHLEFLLRILSLNYRIGIIL